LKQPAPFTRERHITFSSRILQRLLKTDTNPQGMDHIFEAPDEVGLPRARVYSVHAPF